jgi:hypothetical protein
VGLACRTGSLVVARKTDAETFDKIWQLTNLVKSGAKPVKPYVDVDFRMLPTFYPGYRVQPNPALKQLVAELKTLGVTFEDANVHGWKEGLTFKTLESLDVEVGSSAKFA